ncbi:MAG TPA: hypothetical protein VFV84_09260 [Burkholderiales bacterium]|nr:hypothetical protein [Burkholderiales bacterium]
MHPAGSIGRLGFQRWYERELLLSHSWLVACLLCAFALLALLEDLNLAEAGWRGVPVAVTAFAAGCVAWYALARYLTMLMRALHVAERSTCPRCGTHGKYRLVGATPRSMAVRCRQCDSEWSIQ